MNNKPLLLAAFVAFGSISVGARAGELYTPTQYQDPQSTLTRATVKQTVLREQREGELAHNDFAVPSIPTVSFPRTRADVKGEVLAARATGGLEHNDVDLPAVAQGSFRTRQDVRNEALASRATRTAPGKNTIDY